MVNMAVSCPPHIFSRKPLLLGPTLGDKRTPPPRPEIYLQNLSTQHLAAWGSKNSKGESGIVQIS